MALSLDDKLLGEKTHYYCSSSEDEGDGSENEESATKSQPKEPTFIPEEALKEYSGSCTNVSCSCDNQMPNILQPFARSHQRIFEGSAAL